LVVNRFELLRRAEKSGSLSKRVPAREMTHEEVFRRYRGFDGLAWPNLEHAEFQTDEGLADFADLGPVDAYVQRLAHPEECELIALARLDVAGFGLGDWRPAGFDIGYFESEWSHFSVLLNEVIYASRLELRRFASALNKNLLVPTMELALDVIAERGLLLETGADIEEAPHVEPIAIFLRGDGAA
jgi:hypothetical protein